MKTLSSMSLRILVSFFVLLFSVLPAHSGDVISVDVGLLQSELVKLPKDMTHVIIADRDIAGVVKHSARKVSVIGHSIGQTDIRFMNGKRIVRQVNLNVHQNLPAIRKSINKFFPKETVGVEMVNGTVALTGEVSGSEVASQIESVVGEHIGKSGKLLNLMKLKGSQQVMLRVRVGELRRDEIKKLGLGVHGIISAGSAVFGALESDGVFKTLAEPTLTAISGETAQFLAGGEFPVPIAQSGNTMSVDYKSFGVSVDFTPIVLSENRIRLDVASEVSEVASGGSKNVGSMRVPSITTRRANTTVELAPGESFMIAGLIKDKSQNNIHKVPGLGDIPILSPIFRSAEFQRNETELVIAVTPYLATPATSDSIRMPTDGFSHSSMMEMMFLGNLGSFNQEKGGVEGSIGYMVD